MSLLFLFYRSYLINLALSINLLYRGNIKFGLIKIS